MMDGLLENYVSLKIIPKDRFKLTIISVKL